MLEGVVSRNNGYIHVATISFAWHYVSRTCIKPRLAKAYVLYFFLPCFHLSCRTTVDLVVIASDFDLLSLFDKTSVR